MRCAGGRVMRRMGLVVLVSGLGALTACSSGTAVWAGFGALSVTSPLLRGLSQEVEVSCRIAPERAADVTAVTADLSQIGGPIIRPLERIDDDDWGWSGRLIPQQAGERTVTFRATLDDGTFYSQTETVLVNDPGGGGGGGGGGGDNLPPEVADEAATTTGIVGVRGGATVSCTATDQDGTVAGVVADLSELGGPGDVTLTKGAGDAWSWAGELSPLELGEQTVTITATDDDGATGTGSATVMIADGYRLEVAPDLLDIDVFDDTPQTFSATITPPPPAGSTVVYHWRIATLYLGTLVTVGFFPDADELHGQALETDQSAVQYQVVPQPWHPRLRLPIDSLVRCGATITMPVGVADTTTDSADLTISQLGSEVVAAVKERVTVEPDGVTRRVAEAGFEWPMNGASKWLVALLETTGGANGQASNWLFSEVTVANGQKTITEAGNAGLRLDWTSWRSDSGVGLQAHLDNVQRLRDTYTGWRAKVTAWPP